LWKRMAAALAVLTAPEAVAEEATEAAVVALAVSTVAEAVAVEAAEATVVWVTALAAMALKAAAEDEEKKKD
jgi:hypothetical protein